MSDEKKVLPIGIVQGAEFLKASERPAYGEQRLVRHIPVPLPGAKGQVRPAIWTSPYEISEGGANVRRCLVLINKGPPYPEIIMVSIISADLEKCPLMPVEW